MPLKFYNILVVYLTIIRPLNAFSAAPITPDKVLSSIEIQEIHESQNYFFWKSLDETSPVWRGRERKYGSHFLGERDHFYNLDQVIHHVLSDGFPIQYQLEELYQAKLGVHSKLGDLIPKVDLRFPSGVTGIDIGAVFSGLFGFIQPANWMKLVNQKRLKNVAEQLLFRTLLDEVLKAKLLYINQHQLIQEFEILNYYFIHLQVLSDKYQNTSRVLTTLLGKFAYEGTKMASKRGETKLGFNDLSLLMALEKLNGDYTAQNLNITDLDDFPNVVKGLDELPTEYKNKQRYIELVVERSIEMQTAKELLKIAKLNVGITAVGNIFANANESNDEILALRFGYGTLPNILIAESQMRTVKIDVRKEYITMLDIARRSFDYYTNAIGGYTEAKRSLCSNRRAFIANLEHIIQMNEEPDALFILSLDHLLGSELILNNTLHGSLRARAYMDRFLLVDEWASNFLPNKNEILKFFTKKSEILSAKQEAMSFLDHLLKKVRKSSELHSILYQYSKNNPYTLADGDIDLAVKRNLRQMLNSNLARYRSRDFYKVLKGYIEERKLELSTVEQFLLEKRIDSWVSRVNGCKNILH
ncbi:MAG: hypothetical protein AB8G05_18665 [Oligoflexales bacterium]